MYKSTQQSKVTGVYKPNTQIGMESGAEEKMEKPVNLKKKPKGVSDKAWALLNVEGAADSEGPSDFPRISKNNA